MAHSHKDHVGLQCSCCNPLWKALIPDVDLEKLYDKLLHEETPEPTIFTTIFDKDNKPKDYKSVGYIQTMEGGKDVMVEAIGIAEGIIVATGSDQQVRDAMTDYPEFKEHLIYNGQTLLPGFFEPHIHIIPSAVVDMATDVGPYIGQELRSNVETNPKEKYCKEWVFETLKKAGNEHATKDQWIFGRNVDPSLLLDADKAFNASILDEGIGGSRPVFLMNSSMHLAYLNTVGVKLVNANLMKGQDPVDKKGILVEESEFVPVLKMIAYHYFLNKSYNPESIPGKRPEPQLAPTHEPLKPEEKAALFALHLNEKIDAIFNDASARGVTYVFDAGVDATVEKIDKRHNPKDFEVELDQVKLLKIKARANCKVRIGGALIAATLKDYDEKIAGKYQPNKGDKTFNLAYVKVITDGSNQGLTGCQKTPYACNSDYLVYGEGDEEIEKQNNVGVFNYGYPLELNTLVSKAVDNGWPLMVHANGDHALDRSIHAFKQAGVTKATVDARRDRIEHCSLLSDQNLVDMEALGISPSFLIGHVGYWGWVFQQTILGQQRSSQLDRCGSAINDHGIRITLHSDYGVSPIGPLRMMEQSITRVMEGAPQELRSQVLNEAERITRFQALKAMTYDAAWQCHADQWAGSLEKDKCADFVLLETNPLTYGNPIGAYSAKGMRDIPVLETWKGGVKRYASRRSIKVLDSGLEQASLFATHNPDALPRTVVFRHELKNGTEPAIVWEATLEEVQRILTNKAVLVEENSDRTGFGQFSIGDEKEWFFGHNLWNEPGLKVAIYDLLNFCLTGKHDK